MRGTIYQGEKNADTLVFPLPQKYEETDIASYRDVIDELSRSMMWEDMGDEVFPSANTAEQIASIPDGGVANFSAGSVPVAINIAQSVKLNGAAAGLAQNFKQEVR